jgi:hypothetical protein
MTTACWTASMPAPACSTVQSHLRGCVEQLQQGVRASALLQCYLLQCRYSEMRVVHLRNRWADNAMGRSTTAGSGDHTHPGAVLLGQVAHAAVRGCEGRSLCCNREQQHAGAPHVGSVGCDGVARVGTLAGTHQHLDSHPQCLGVLRVLAPEQQAGDAGERVQKLLTSGAMVSGSLFRSSNLPSSTRSSAGATNGVNKGRDS